MISYRLDALQFLEPYGKKLKSSYNTNNNAGFTFQQSSKKQLNTHNETSL